MFRDFSGICGDMENSLSEYISGNEPYDDTEILFFESEEDPEFLSILKKCGTALSEDRIAYFSKLLKKKQI